MRNNHSHNNHNQNKRMRGRNRGGGGGGGGKSHNPLTRVYESNGPDVKIRGTANHVAEKYIQLARDAQTSGDPVAAENYYQHAEHYFRVINAQNQTNGRPRQQMPTPAEDQSMGGEGEGEDENGNGGEGQARQAQPQAPVPGEGDQPDVLMPVEPSEG